MSYEDIMKMSDDEFIILIKGRHYISNSFVCEYKNNVKRFFMDSSYHYEADELKLMLVNKRFNKIRRRSFYLCRKYSIFIDIVASYLKEFLNVDESRVCHVLNDYLSDNDKYKRTSHRVLCINIYKKIMIDMDDVYTETQIICKRLFYRNNDLIISKFEKRKLSRLLNSNENKISRRRL